MFYVIGDIDRAIDYSGRLLTDPNFNALSDEDRMFIDFNIASFLVEREYHSPTRDSHTRAQLCAEIDAILNSEPLSSQNDIASSVLDTRGLAKITFASTKEQARQGIEDCVRAVSLAPSEEAEVTAAYMELNVRLGWRRYFELENITRPR